MKAIGRHLTVDMYGCGFDNLNNLEFIKIALLAAIEEANMTLLNANYHQFEPYGLAALALLTESHLTIHTYPDLGYAAIDIFTSGDLSQPEKVLTVLRRYLKPEKTKTTNIMRGDFGSQKDMKPRIKVSIAPLRRVRNTSAKVWSYLRKK